jgi:hypothetical protein
MQRLNICRRALSACAAVAIAGCGGSQPPIGAPGAMPQTSVITAHADRAESWMLPQARTIRKLLYISDDYPDEVLVYDYNTGTLVGTLSDFQDPAGQCVDKKGDIWIADAGAGTVSEYAHGGTSILRSVTAINPVGCAVDSSGDLAVTASSSSGPDELEIWKNASGQPSVYSNKTCYLLLTPAYDDRGNLVVEGGFDYSSADGKWYPCELLSGSTQLVVAKFDRSLHLGGGATWDGRHIALTVTRSKGSTRVIRIAIEHGGGITALGESTLAGDDPTCKNFHSVVGAPFVVGDKNTPVNRTRGSVIVGGDICPESRFGYWHYPSGGAPFKPFGSQPEEPGGSSVSIAY